MEISALEQRNPQIDYLEQTLRILFMRAPYDAGVAGGIGICRLMLAVPGSNSSQRLTHDEPIFRLLLKVAVKEAR